MPDVRELVMPDDFWQRDYVVEHLKNCPNDHEFLERLAKTFYTTCGNCGKEVSLMPVAEHDNGIIESCVVAECGECFTY
jgi:hypothetical protein